jgi:putative selenium metabolism protein SsnA
MLITNGVLVTLDSDQQMLTGQALYVADGRIAAIGPQAELAARYPDAERLDARGQLVMPGAICAHTHFYGAYARGMAIPGPAPKDFPEILARLWWPLDKALDKDAVRLSALVSLVDAVKHGTTALIDHHASPNAIDGSLDWIADAVDRAGLRAVLCYEVTDRDGLDKADSGIAENVRFMQASAAHPRIRGTFGLHASLTLGERTLRACADAHPGGGFHVHVAEHEADEQDSLAKAGMHVIPRLHQFGLLGPRTIAAHCVHVTTDELDRLEATGTWISHQPRSNMNNAVGAMSFDAMMAREMRIVLGNDGFSNAMWQEWKAAYFLHKVVSRDPRAANGADVFRAGTANNAALLETFFAGERFGVLAEGARADLIFVDYQPFTPLTGGNLPWHVLFGFEPSMVTMTMVDGRVLMRDRELLTLDERAIMAEALAHAPAVWERYARYAAQ